MDYNDPELTFGEKKEEEVLDKELTETSENGEGGMPTPPEIPAQNEHRDVVEEFNYGGFDYGTVNNEHADSNESTVYSAPSDVYSGTYSSMNQSQNSYTANEEYTAPNDHMNYNENASYNTNGEYGANGSYNMNNNTNGNYSNMSYQPQPQKEGVGAMAVISLVMGILSLVCCCVGFGLPFGIVGIILSAISISSQKGKGVAIGGLVTSIIGTVFSLILIIYFVFAYNSVMKNPDFKDLMEYIQSGTYQYDDNGNSNPFGDDWMDGMY